MVLNASFQPPKRGDRVHLTTNPGIVMGVVVPRNANGEVLCSWLDLNGHKQEGLFPEELLERVPPDPIEPVRARCEWDPFRQDADD
jgi:hypothetical protein